MKVEKIKITDIIPADYNPRQISENEKMKLKNSIEEFGLVDPIVVNLKNNTIIGGHQRFDALLAKSQEDGDFLQELNLIKLGDIGWVFKEEDLKIESEAHEKALNLALNKISGDWDLKKLNNLLEDLEVENFDVSLSGFDEVEIMELKLENDIDFWDEVEDDIPDQEAYDEDDEGTVEEAVVCPECGAEFYP